MGFFDKLLNAITGGAADPSRITREQVNLLKQAVEPLEAINKALPDQALEFIVQGTQETVLLTLQNARAHEPGLLLGSPGRLRWGFNLYNNKAVEKAGMKSLAGRSPFYAKIDPQAPPLDLLIRLGKLLAAADGGKSLEVTGAPVPDWLHYLINDAVHASHNGKDKNLNSSRPAWTITLIAQLLAREGLDDNLALQFAFERKDLNPYYHDHLQSLVDSEIVAALLRQRPEAAQALPSQLSAAGRVLLARRIGGDKPLLNDFASLFVALAVDGSKAVRTEAALYLDGLDQAQRLTLLGQLLREGDSTQRVQAAELIARLPGDSARAQLEEALAAETSKPVQQAIRGALSRLDAVDDAGTLTLPEPPAWQPYADAPLGEEAVRMLIANRRELLEQLRQGAEKEIAENKEHKRSWSWRQNNYKKHQKLSDDDIHAAVRVLNGEESEDDRKRMNNSVLQEVITHRRRLDALPGFGVTHLVRWLSISRGWRGFWFDDIFQKWLNRQPADSVDLRALAELLQRSGSSIRQVANAALYPGWNAPSAIEVLPPERVWPFFAEHPEFIDEGLGLIAPPNDQNNRYSGFSLAQTLQTLAVFPAVQARWLPRVMEIALGEGRTYRADAQAALAKLPDIGQRVIEALDAGKSEVRIEAARWLAELKYNPAIVVLNKALEKESRETVRAAYLTTLEALGENIMPRLAPATLLAEANKGLKVRPPAGLAWFPLDALPTAQWRDGTPVEPNILRWWLVLACKLKEPGGNALLTRYLGLLDTPSRRALGAMVLRQFIAQDTRHPSLDEGIAYASATAPRRYQNYQSRYQNAELAHKQHYEANYQKTQEQVFEECKREKMSEYLGSAIGEKGILALAAYTPGHEAVTLLRQYMRDHYPRRAQIEAMLESIAGGNDPVVTQLLLAISRRYRTASVMQKARTLVEGIAERNGWTQEQLADRTIPTAGFDDSGVLTLPYGERVFTLALDAAMKPELRNAEGKIVKALPEPRQNDDPAQIKEAKSQLSTSKKEIKQVIELQTARLFEAMCAGRLWPAGEWREYLHGHPIAGRLIQRLVWLAVDADSQVLTSFRPTEDGSLIDTRDEEIELAPDAWLRLAHGSLVDEALASAWTKHFKDYKVTPLFPQMARRSPAIAFDDAHGQPVKEIADRQGWVSDTFTLRSSFAKLGYQHGQAEDGGFFYQYLKEFPSVGVRVAIDFSGNTLPEENIPAALKTLSFEDMRVRSWNDRQMALARVPPVLLAEAYADYLTVAQACTGFDAEWEKKMLW